jgi:hypothetical protein
MILALHGEVAVAAIERFIELFGDAPIGLGCVQGSPPGPVRAKILQTKGLPKPT